MRQIRPPLRLSVLFTLAFVSAWRSIDCFSINNIKNSPIYSARLGSVQKSRVVSSLRPMNVQKRSALYVQSEGSQIQSSTDDYSNAFSEAEKLRLKAKELMKEAEAAENALRSSKQNADEMKRTLLDGIYEEITDGILSEVVEGEVDLTTETELNRRLANRLRAKRLSSSTMVQLIERLHDRLCASEKRLRTDLITSTESQFNIGDASNSVEYNEVELRTLRWWIQRIVQAQELVDKDDDSVTSRGGTRGLAPILEARIRELQKAEEEEYQRLLALKLNKKNSISDGPLVGSFTKQTLGEQNVTIKVDGKEISGPKVNMTRLMEDIAQVPMWVPSSILPFLIVCTTELNPDDLKKIRSEVLPGSQFNVENWDYTRTAAIYRGSFVDKKRAALYSTSSIGFSEPNEEKGDERQSEVAFREVQDRLEKSGLSDRIQVFLMEDPEWRPGDRDPEPLPSILAVSSNVIPEQGTERGNAKKFVTGLSVVSTLFATFAYSISGFALNPSFFNSVVNENDISMLSSCIPIFFGVLGVSLVHEVAHRIAAIKSGVKIGLPVPLPSLQIGTFGSITPLRSFPRSRTDLFDLAVSGPLAGGITSILLIIVGIYMTVHASADALSTFAVIPAALLKASFLTGSLASIFAPKVMALPVSQLVPIHPLFLVGFAGLVSSAVNLLPIGRLDGGRACTSIFGRRSAYLVSFAMLAFLAIAALTQTSAISIFWGLLVTVFQRNLDVPMRDELSDVDNVRVGVYIFSIVLTVLTLAPFPGGPPL